MTMPTDAAPRDASGDALLICRLLAADPRGLGGTAREPHSAIRKSGDFERLLHAARPGPVNPRCRFDISRGLHSP